MINHTNTSAPSSQTEWESRLEAWRASAMAPIFPLLRHQLVHVTSAHGLAGMLECGAIQPNHGQFDNTYPQSASSYAHQMQAVSLFDFGSATCRQCIEQEHNWAPFFTVHRPLTIAIMLDREKLFPDLVHYGEVRAEVGPVVMSIPHVEAWYLGELSVQHFDSLMAIVSGSQRMPGFFFFDCDDWGFEHLTKLAAWVDQVNEQFGMPG